LTLVLYTAGKIVDKVQLTHTFTHVMFQLYITHPLALRNYAMRPIPLSF